MSKDVEFSEKSLRKIAEQKVSYRRSVKIHWSFYIVVNLLLLVINLVTNNFLFLLSHLWVIYPVLGWFIGVMMHTVAYLQYARGVYPMAKRAVIYHFTAYLTVNLLLTMTNLATMSGFYWVLFPIGFWAIGFIVHFMVYYIYYRGKITDAGEGKTKKERAIEKEMEKMKKKMDK
jgi:hypothetical protein